jgi:hypothetical protein
VDFGGAANLLTWAKIIAALLVAWILVVVWIGLHLSRRLARVERWNIVHGPPLVRLAAEQRARASLGRAVAARRPHRSGTDDVPH